MDLRVVGTFLLALGLLGVVAVGGAAGEIQVEQGDTVDGVTGDSHGGEIFVESGSSGPTAEGEFAIGNVSANVPVAGEALDVVVGVENVGNASATQTVDVTVDGLGSNSTAVTLGPGESTEATLAVGTAEGDAGQYDAVVTTGDDQTTEPVLVVAPAEFAVDIVDAPASVDPGEDIEVTAAIENAGEVDDTQTVMLDIGELGSDAAAVELPFGESTEETFTVSTSEGDAGEYTATVASEDDTASTPVVVEGQSEFAIENVSANVPVAGEALDVVVGVENVGGGTATETVAVTLDGLGSNSTAVTLGAGESTETTLAVGTADGDAGQYDAVVTAGDDQTTEPVLVVAPAEFAVDIVDAPNNVAPGEDIEVTAAIENVGEVDDTQTVTLSVEGLGSDSAEVALPFGESTEETFAVSTSGASPGPYTATVASEDDEASEMVVVTGSPEFEIVDVEMDGSLVEGELLEMTVEVANVGTGPGSAPVEVYADGLGSENMTLELGAGESAAETVGLDTDIGDTGEHIVYIETPGHGIEEPVLVHLPTMPGEENPPQDTNGDNRYEDADGDGTFDIFDVQLFFNHFDHGMMDDHGWAFDFNDDGAVTIFDVQAQFNDL